MVFRPFGLALRHRLSCARCCIGQESGVGLVPALCNAASGRGNVLARWWRFRFGLGLCGTAPSVVSGYG